jgi:hypothetical protein
MAGLGIWCLTVSYHALGGKGRLGSGRLEVLICPLAIGTDHCRVGCQNEETATRDRGLARHAASTRMASLQHANTPRGTPLPQSPRVWASQRHHLFELARNGFAPRVGQNAELRVACRIRMSGFPAPPRRKCLGWLWPLRDRRPSDTNGATEGAIL